MTEYKDILEALPTLSGEELRNVIKASNLVLLGITGDKSRPTPASEGPALPEGTPYSAIHIDSLAEPLYRVLHGFLTKRVGDGGPPWEVFSKGDRIDKWNDATKGISRLFELARVSHRRASKFTACKTIILSLAHMLERQKIPISHLSMVSNIGRFREAFEGAFPGYLQAGIAHLVLKASRGKKING